MLSTVKQIGRCVVLRRSGSCVVMAAAAPASAQVSFVGDWTGRYHEDQPDRVPGRGAGRHSAACRSTRRRGCSATAGTWRATRCSSTSARRTRCRIIFFGPNQFRIWEERHPDTQELIAIQMYIGTYQQRRTIWMDGRPHPPDYAPHTFMGFSTGEWNGDILTITTTHIKAGYFRRSGVPTSDRHDGGRALDASRQRAVAGDDRHRSGVSDRAVHPQPGIRADGARQHQLALQLRVRDGGAARQERGAALPARPEPVDGRVRGASTRCRRKACAAAPRRCVPEWKPGAKPAGRRAAGANGGFQPGAAAGEARRLARCRPFTCRATCT